MCVFSVLALHTIFVPLETHADEHVTILLKDTCESGGNDF